MRTITFELPASLWRRLVQPFSLLLFLYFFFVSAELLYAQLWIFKFRFNLLIGFGVFSVFFFRYHVLRLDRDFLQVALSCVGSMILSAVFGYYLSVCVFFIVLFVFNYLVFFVFPTNLFRVFDNSAWILKLYFFSFVPVGIFATFQVVFSLFGVILPGVTQSIYLMSRGQAFSYEPSYYALYMTPFAIFETAKYFLQEKNEKNIWKVLGANFLLLVSTSTGCFFSYIALIVTLGCLKFARIIRNVSFAKIVWRILGALGGFFAVLWMLYPTLVYSGFLKLFWAGVFYHGTFQDRWKGIVMYWDIFKDFPILGSGLGGASAYYAKKEGLTVAANDPMILERGIAMNVTTEILGSLGLVGIIAFGYFFWVLWRNCKKTLRIQQIMPDERINVIAFIVSLCVMFFALQFSQSIMRPYVWLHVGISMGYMKYLQYKYRYSEKINSISDAD